MGGWGGGEDGTRTGEGQTLLLVFHPRPHTGAQHSRANNLDTSTDVRHEVKMQDLRDIYHLIYFAADDFQCLNTSVFEDASLPSTEYD